MLYIQYVSGFIGCFFFLLCEIEKENVQISQQKIKTNVLFVYLLTSWDSFLKGLFLSPLVLR